MRYFVPLLIVSLLVVSSVGADSIWGEESASPYSTLKVYKVGDIINIIILESTSAKNVAGTKTNVKDDLAASLTHTIARLNPIIGPSNTVNAGISNVFDGKGTTSRTSNVTARIAAWVTDVMPNGNLAVKGQHRVEVNSEIQEITITGIVRAKDISGSNTVYSYQVADASVSVKGSGAVAESENPGWLTRIFNWLF